MAALGPSPFIGAALFLLISLSGVQLTRSGRPYNALVFNFHKLVALALTILTVLTLYPLSAAAGENRQAAVLFLALSGLLFLSLIISGGLLNALKTPPKAALGIHRAAPLLAALAVIVTAYLLAGSSS